MRKTAALLAAAVMTIGGLAATAAPATAGDSEPTCVPHEAWTETIQHPAVTHVVHHDAVTHVVHHDAVTHTVHHDATPDLWWNWSPNHEQGPFDGPPSFPTDDRGTWEGPHENGGPSQDTYGTFQQGEGHGSWFHREHGQAAYDETVVDQPAYDETVVDQPAYDETVVDQAAWTETINHPAVTCDTPCPDDECNLPVMQGSKGDVVCDGALVGGVYRNVTVRRGDTCVLADVYVNGSVRASGARNLLVHDATIRGNVTARGVTGDVYLGSKQSCRYDPLVGGTVTVAGSHNVLICDMKVCKDIVVKGNDGRITIRSTKARRIVVTGNRHFVSDGNVRHKRTGDIRLIHVKAKRVVTSGNAPRRVVRR